MIPVVSITEFDAVENHAAFTIHFKENERLGTLEVLCLKVNNDRWTLPGGSQSFVEEPLETARRELLHEVAEHFEKQESLTVYFDKEPVKIIEAPRDGGGIHRKYFFLAFSLNVVLRTREIPEPDMGGDILGIPEYIGLNCFIEKLKAQGKRSEAQLAGLLAALERACEKQTSLAQRISWRYAGILSHTP